MLNLGGPSSQAQCHWSYIRLISAHLFFQEFRAKEGSDPQQNDTPATLTTTKRETLGQFQPAINLIQTNTKWFPYQL